MAKKALIKYVQFMMLALSVALAVFHLMGLYGGYVLPANNLAFAMMVFAVPVLFFFNLLMLLYWLIRRLWHWAIIPLVPLVLSFYYIGGYLQFNPQPDDAQQQKGVTIASYNIARFGSGGMASLVSQDILSAMTTLNVDILCLQEYKDDGGYQRIRDVFKKVYPYMAFGLDDMVIFSRFPIVNSKLLDFQDTNNSAMRADIKVNGKIWRIYNVHMETTGINGALHSAGKLAMTGQIIERSDLFNYIYGNYTMGLKRRSGQAIQVANDIRMDNPGYTTFVVGDFNDVPCSYVYNTLKGDLVDGFRECGFGYHATYRGSRQKKLRIDYIFHSEDVEGIKYYTEDLTYSDHLPVIMKIKQ